MLSILCFVWRNIERSQAITDVMERQNLSYNGYQSGIPSKAYAYSNQSVKRMTTDMVMVKYNPGVRIPFVGEVGDTYVWTQRPDDISAARLLAGAPYRNPMVRLPLNYDIPQFNNDRNVIQRAVLRTYELKNAKGVDQIALALGGVILEATMPCYCKEWIPARKENDVLIHCIFQTGLNFTGNGGLKINDAQSLLQGPQVLAFAQANALAAAESAVSNQSDFLIFNIGIGAGFFANRINGLPAQIEEANVNGLCFAAQKYQYTKLRIVVCYKRFEKKHKSKKKQLQDAGIVFLLGLDQDAVAAVLAADDRFRVSKTIAADPMTMLGVHGPGLWWQSVGSASDEERAAYLSDCYGLGHIPILVIPQKGKGNPAKIAAISEFMIRVPSGVDMIQESLQKFLKQVPDWTVPIQPIAPLAGPVPQAEKEIENRFIMAVNALDVNLRTLQQSPGWANGRDQKSYDTWKGNLTSKEQEYLHDYFKAIKIVDGASKAFFDRNKYLPRTSYFNGNPHKILIIGQGVRWWIADPTPLFYASPSSLQA